MNSLSYYDLIVESSDAEDFICTWLVGLDDEIQDWVKAYEEWSNTAKNINFDTDTFLDRNREVKFEWLREWQGAARPRVLDVGSGAFSWIGTKTPMGEIELHAYDALADVFSPLSRKFQLPPYIEIEHCVAERLVGKYGSESFYFVIMNNALDHTFDAILGIKNLLSILKVGGTLYLGHFVNEASNGNFNGIHQWGLDCRNGDAILARGNYIFNITKYASTFCEVKTEFENGERWIGNDKFIPADRVISLITKKQESPKIFSDTLPIYDQIINNILIYENSSVYRNVEVENAKLVS